MRLSLVLWTLSLPSMLSMEDIAHGRGSQQVRDFLVQAYVRGAEETASKANLPQHSYYAGGGGTPPTLTDFRLRAGRPDRRHVFSALGHGSGLSGEDRHFCRSQGNSAILGQCPGNYGGEPYLLSHPRGASARSCWRQFRRSSLCSRGLFIARSSSLAPPT